MFDVIVACTSKGGIAQDGKIPWHITQDLKHFSKTTRGGIVIMGRKTWESLPKRPLPNRINIIISSRLKKDDVISAIVCTSLQEALDHVKTKHPTLHTFVIGGAELYKESLLHPDCKRVYVTEIYNEIPCDTYFPLDIVKSTRFHKAFTGMSYCDGQYMFSMHEYESN